MWLGSVFSFKSSIRRWCHECSILCGLNCDFLQASSSTVGLSRVRGKLFTEVEKIKIKKFSKRGLIERPFILKINKFKAVVHNFLYDPINYIKL